MSSKPLISPRQRTYARLIGEVRRALNEALIEENKAHGLTKSKIAATLGKNKSFVSRQLNGTGNMTLETLADLAYALNRPVKIAIPSRGVAAHTSYGSNQSGSQSNSTSPVIPGRISVSSL